MAGYLIDLNDEEKPVVAPSAQAPRTGYIGEPVSGKISTPGMLERAAASAISETPGVSQEFGGPPVGKGFLTGPVFGEGGALQRLALGTPPPAPAIRETAGGGGGASAFGVGAMDNGNAPAPADNFGPGIGYNIPKPGAAAPGPIAGAGYNAADTQIKLDAYRARELQDQQSRIGAMQNNANWAAAWTANRDAQNAARVATFRATNGADMVLAGGNPAYDDQRTGILQGAKAASDKAATTATDLTKAQAALSGPPRNYIDEFGKLQNTQSIDTTAKSRMIEADARAKEAGSRSELERAQATGVKLSNEQQQRILTLAQAMGEAKTPTEMRKFERQIIALAGKNPAEWKAVKLAGEERFVNGMPAGKDPDRLVLYNEQTNETMEIGGSGGGGSFRKPSEDAVAQAKKIGDTPANRAALLANYGPEETKRILGK